MLAQLALVLERLGCPPHKSGEMAAQLEKRARQLTAQTGRPYEESMRHLLALLRQGGLAQAQAQANTETAETAETETEAQGPAGGPGSALVDPIKHMIRPWEKVSSKPLGDYRIFTVRSDEKISPRTGKKHDFFVIDCVDWVNVLAVTPDDHLVMVEQYRHGSNTVELEIPGGIMDAADRNPVETAVRELREETGYAGENPRVLGSVFANPAIMSNTSHFVLVENCTLQHGVEFDSGEDILTRRIPIADVPGLVTAGRIRHPLVVVALYHFELHRRR